MRVRSGFSLLAESARIHTHQHGARSLISTFQLVQLGARSPAHSWGGSIILLDAATFMLDEAGDWPSRWLYIHNFLERFPAFSNLGPRTT